MEVRLRTSARSLKLGIAIAILAWLGHSGWLLRAEIFSIRAYQQVGSPIASRVVTCRFRPTCSHYAVKALNRDGLLLGNLKIGARLAHCSPAGALYDWLRAEGPQTAARSSSE